MTLLESSQAPAAERGRRNLLRYRARLFAGLLGAPAALFLLGLVPLPVAMSQSADLAGATRYLRQRLAQLDSDGDRLLTATEFLQRSGPAEVLKRDFHLFDLDGSGSLSSSEFASVWGLVEPSLRGPMPDPMDDLVADAVAALDQSYDDWNLRPGELVNAHTFVANFIGSISLGQRRYVTGRILVHADRSGDGRLSRAEAKRFLEYQLGIRWLDGPRLREPTGRLVRFDLFLRMDQDQSNHVSRQEFASHWPHRQTVQEDFLRNDRDRSGTISYSELAHFAATSNYFDPVEWFRDADKNLDARLDDHELRLATSRERRHLVSSTVPAFDDDGDGKLSLQEYRLSMLCNVNYSWETPVVDLNRDGRLSYDEFVFNKADLFQLQRRFYFHRLDRDGDGTLSPDEFEFTSQQPFGIQTRPAGGGPARVIYRSRRYPDCGWPQVSPDGTQILFHRCLGSVARSDASPKSTNSRIAVMNLDGHNVRDLCDGSHPSWSDDGKHFTCVRRPTGADEVWLMGADGRSGQRLASGRSSRWAPDGHAIAYQHDGGLWLYDVSKHIASQIFARGDHRYRDLGDDIAWSPDASRIAVLGHLPEAAELVILSVADTESPTGPTAHQRIIPLETDNHRAQPNLNWTAGQGILLGLGRDDRPVHLVSIDPREDAPQPRIIPWSDGWKSACLTPDGKWYIGVAEDR